MDINFGKPSLGIDIIERQKACKKKNKGELGVEKTGDNYVTVSIK
jgi:hypothetical protein